MNLLLDTFNPSGGAENEDTVFFVKNTALEDSFTITAGGDVFANGQIRTNMPSQPTTPAILLNADETGTPSSDVIAIEVERGTEPNAKITWDEQNGDRWDFNYGLYLNTNSQIKIEKPTTPATTPAILLNADRTGNGDEADVVAIEVERGTETNAQIKWDETNDSWLVSPKLNLNHNLTPYYVYMTHNANSYDNNEYFHFFSSPDNGTTREVIKLYDLDTTHFTEDTSLGFSRYKASFGTSWGQTTPIPTLTGVIYFETGKSYFLEIKTDYTGNTNGVKIYISSSFPIIYPTYTNIIFGTSPHFFQLVLNQTIDGTNWSTNALGMDGASTTSDYYPSSTLITLNDVNRDNYDPVDSPKIEVDRGTETNSYIKWDEANDVWNLHPNILAAPKLVPINSNHTVDVSEGSIFHLDGGGFTVTLPISGITNGTTIFIHNAGSGNKLVDTTALGDKTLAQNASITLYHYFGSWIILSTYGTVT